MVLNKKISKFRQWVGEKVGTNSKSDLGDELTELDSRVEQRYIALLALRENTKWYMKAYSQVKEINKDDISIKNLSVPNQKLNRPALLAKAMKDYAVTFKQTSEYAKILLSCSECLSEVSKIDTKYSQKIDKDYLVELDECLYRVKNYNKARRKMESRRLYYDSCLNKINKTKKENASLEGNLELAKSKFDESRNILMDLGKEIVENENNELVGLLSFFKSAVEYHKSCTDRFCEFAMMLNKIIDSMLNDPKNASKPSLTRKLTSLSGSSITKEKNTTIDSKTSNYNVDDTSLSSPSQSVHNAIKAPNNDSHENGLKTSTVDEVIAPINLSDSPVGKYAIAKYTFTSDYEGDMSFEKGEKIKVIRVIDDGWWEGTIEHDGQDTKCGIFPANYCSLAPFEDTLDEKKVHAVKDELVQSEPNPNINPISQHDENDGDQHGAINENDVGQQGAVYSIQEEIKQRLSSVKPLRSSKNVKEPTTRYNDPISSQDDIGVDYPCSKCNCISFKKNVFKESVCGNCYHSHVD